MVSSVKQVDELVRSGSTGRWERGSALLTTSMAYEEQNKKSRGQPGSWLLFLRGQEK
jgi:hypothetical protein